MNCAKEIWTNMESRMIKDENKSVDADKIEEAEVVETTETKEAKIINMKPHFHDFKVGDSVEVVNAVKLMGLEEGMRGRVVLLTEDGNIGVKFRRRLEKGTDLGGKCADGHGLICLAMDLKRK